MTDTPINLEDVQRLHLEPGDVLVISYEKDLGRDEVGTIKSRVEDMFPGHKAMVLTGGLKLSVADSKKAYEPLPMEPIY